MELSEQNNNQLKFHINNVKIRDKKMKVGKGMLENVEKIELLSITQGICSKYRLYKNRPSHAFIFKINGESRYDFQHRHINLEEGEMLYIPKGETYTVRQLSAGLSEYLIINFAADIPGSSPTKFNISNFTDAEYFFSRAAKLWFFGKPSDRYKCLSIFYEILSIAAASENLNYFDLKQSRMIEPAVKYLEAHIFDETLQIEKLSSLCGISDTHFRKLFVAQFQVSPKRYVINKRMMEAKALIDGADYNSIAEVAAAVGYTDALYFSKVFKKYYGGAPSTLRHNNMQ